jgi:hypothetical protein
MLGAHAEMLIGFMLRQARCERNKYDMPTATFLPPAP